jgi:hypothetical protein
MKREAYLKESLASLQADLVKETDFVKGLKKDINSMRRAGCTPSDHFEAVIAEGEIKKDSLAGAIKILEQAIKARK